MLIVLRLLEATDNGSRDEIDITSELVFQVAGNGRFLCRPAEEVGKDEVGFCVPYRRQSCSVGSLC